MLELSENQRIQFQLGKENQPDSTNMQIGDFPRRKTAKDLLHNGRHIQNRETKEVYRLKMNAQMLLGRKNEVVGELDFAVEIFTATFWFIMDCIRLCSKEAFVFMLVVAAMQARLSRLAETARHLMRLGAIMELHVPAHRNEKHHKGHQKGTDLQQSFFHGRKSTE